MNDQEIFDFVANHLLTQNARSMLPDNVTCAYRGGGGLMCAVGCLITDEAYHEGLEVNAANDPFVSIALQESGVVFSENTMKLLLELQSIHDSEEYSYIKGFWAERLQETAHKYNLDWKF